MKWAQLTTAVMGALFLSALAFGVQEAGVDRDLDEAKVLYREAKFAQAIGRLHTAIARLERLRDVQARTALADAHLHLALSYVALNDPTAATESLKAMLRVDPQRRLDAEVYAPKVLGLFEQARAELAAEPRADRSRSGGPVSVPIAAAPAQKKSSKTLPIVLGVAAAAGGVVALAAGGGGGGGSSETSPSVSSSQDDVAFVTTTPAPGSTISMAAILGGGLRVTFRYTLVSRDATCLAVGHATAQGGIYCTGANVTIQRGTDVVRESALGYATTTPGCTPPIDMTVIQLAMFGDGSCSSGSPFVDRHFGAALHIVP